MKTKSFKGIEERTFYRNNKAYADHVAVFEDSDGNVVCSTSDNLTKAAVFNGEERKNLAGVSVSKREIDKAHREFSYQNVRLEISKKERPKKSEIELTISGKSTYEFRGELILGAPSLHRVLKAYSPSQKL